MFDGQVWQDGQHFGEIGPRIESVPLAGLGEAGQDRGGRAACVGSEKQPILAADGDLPQSAFGRVVVCALLRCGEPSGVIPDRRKASQPEALGAYQEATNGLKHSQRRLLSKEVSGHAGRNVQ